VGFGVAHDRSAVVVDDKHDGHYRRPLISDEIFEQAAQQHLAVVSAVARAAFRDASFATRKAHSQRAKKENCKTQIRCAKFLNSFEINRKSRGSDWRVRCSHIVVNKRVLVR
jgi:hypothetical protein